MITVSFVRKYDLATRWKKTSDIGNEGEKKLSTTIAYSLSQDDIEDDANVEYELRLRRLRACAERASKPLTTNLDRISKNTEEC
ncbi:hypothetical protein RB195_022525 [Necator americanus]|uniref:Uncharacterized protein n=1 Tax=Necator americanus TaxID=51031 RepID=A0ABR1EI69_NECAM